MLCQCIVSGCHKCSLCNTSWRDRLLILQLETEVRTLSHNQQRNGAGILCLKDIRTLCNGTPVQGASGGPPPADAVVAAVAQSPAHWAGPLILLCHLQNVFAISHEETVPTQHTLHDCQSGLSVRVTTLLGSRCQHKATQISNAR